MAGNIGLEERTYNIGFFAPIFRIGRRTFGWRKESEETWTTVDSYQLNDDGKITKNTTDHRKMTMVRPNCFQGNALFSLLDYLDRLIFLLRKLIVFAVVLMFVGTACQGETLSMYSFAYVLIVLFASAVVIVIGCIMKYVGGYEKKTNDYLNRNGYNNFY